MKVEYPVTVPDIIPLMRDYISPQDDHDTYADRYGYGSENPDFFTPFQPDLEGTHLDGKVTTLPALLTAIGEGGAPLMLEMLNACGVDAAVVHAYDTLEHEIVAKVQKQSHGRLVGLAGASPKTGSTAVKQIEHAIGELGLKGVSIAPYANGIYADDPAFYPIYSKCSELGVPINIHGSTHLLRNAPNDCSHPSRLDRVAIDFPDLAIVAHHGGWPWVLELMSVALRHPNFYISPAGMRPRNFAKPGSGWDALLQFGDTLLRDRILWGSNWPMLPIRRSLDEIKALPLREASLDAWLGGNAARLFNLNPSPDS